MLDKPETVFGTTNRISAADFVGNAIDRLITIEAKNPGMPHNVTERMYSAARELAGDRPLSMIAAEKLLSTVKAGDTVLFLTGAGYPPQMPKGEDDGPPGAASLAYALYRGLGVVPVFVCESCHVDPIIAATVASGMMVVDFEDARDRHLGSAIEIAPTGQADIPAWIDMLFTEMKPKAIICSERLGPASNGFLHNLTAQAYGGPGTTVTYDVIDISGLVTRANDEKILTIGTGDHGNEIGFGQIMQTIAEVMPNGSTLCTTVATDVLIPAMMSNWGCYGIEAALSFLLKRPNLMHSAAQEERIIRACQMAGGIDAVLVSTEFAVDGLEGETSMACVQFLGNIVRKALEAPDRGFAH